MATDNEWLRLIFAQLAQGGAAGVSINQSQVKAAIESATNLDQLETPLASLAAADSWRSLTLTTASGSYAATGTGFEFTVPANKEWQFQAAYIPFTTSSTAANRVLRAYASSSAGFVAFSASRVTQTATQTRYYNVGLYPSLDVVVDSQYIYLPLPPLILGAGDKIGVTVPSLAAGDAFANPIVKVMERSP